MLIEQAWAALVGEVSGGDTRPARVSPAGPNIEIAGQQVPNLVCAYPLQDLALACVSVALLAASSLEEQRGRGPARPVRVDRAHVAAAFRSERLFVGSDRSLLGTLSRFWRVADGWVRTQANAPWHAAALLRAVGVQPESDDSAVLIRAVEDALAGMSGEQAQERIFAAGGIAGAMRSVASWRDHPQGQAVAREPLIGHEVLDGARPRPHEAADLPARGLRVLDLTRVIAGPNCTKYLGALGADVLRLDPPQYPDGGMTVGTFSDALLGKRSAFLGLDTDHGLALLHGLLDDADVVVCGYRPGALSRFGLGPEDLARRHPGLVVVYLSAWGHSGPWAERRGFDSVVQSPTGISTGLSAGRDKPVVAPCAFLDYGTGYLAAAAALDGVRRQMESGGTHIRRVSLARTAAWLTSSVDLVTTAPVAEAEDASPWMIDLTWGGKPVKVVTPVGQLGDSSLSWPEPDGAYGEARPEWKR